MIPSNLGEDAAWELVQRVKDAEVLVLERIGKMAAQGVNLPAEEYARVQLANVQKLRTQIIRDLSTSYEQVARNAEASISWAYKQGGNAALLDLSAIASVVDSASSPAGRAAVELLSRELSDKLAESYNSVLRSVPDDYRSVIGSVATQGAIGSLTTKQAVDKALVDFFGKGISVAPANSRGARMSLPDYTAMAVRTGAARAAVDGHTQALTANGLNLCMIQLGPRACDICDGWANLVLSVDGTVSGTIEQFNHLTGGTIKVKVDSSLPTARSRGWGHPNCRCGIKAYIPGVTKTDPRRVAWDEEGYKAQQRQREIERNIRDAKTREALAVSPEDRAAARARVREWQQRQRDHMDSHPYLKRQSVREQITGPVKGQFRSTATGTTGPVSTLRRSATEDKLVSRLDSEFKQYKKSDGTEWGQPEGEAVQRLFKRYTTNEGYGFNQELRIRASGGIRGALDTTPLSQQKKYLKGADNLAAEIQKAPPTTVDTRLSRYTRYGSLKQTFPGIPPELFDDPEKLAAALVGKQYQENGFLSTSFFGPRGSEAVNPDKVDVHIDILVPKGAKALNVDPISQYQGELEVLFPPGVKYTVVDATPHVQKNTKYEVNGTPDKTGLRIVILIDPSSTVR